MQKAKGRAQPIYECTSFASKLTECFGVDVRESDKEIFPPYFCNPCYVTMNRVDTAVKKGIPYFPTTKVFAWTRHTTSHCPVSSLNSYAQTLTLPHTRFVSTLPVSAKEGGKTAK